VYELPIFKNNIFITACKLLQQCHSPYWSKILQLLPTELQQN